MIGLLQRVSRASVTVEGGVIGEIGRGLLVLVGVERDDTQVQAARLLERLLGYRVFPDAAGKMNLGLRDLVARGESAGLLLVPQFTLAADTQSGMRPGFSTAAPPAQGEQLFTVMVELARRAHAPVAAGRFGAAMQVSLINDGPVTFWLQVS